MVEEKRYQVFISSTYRDLIDERNEVMQALLELECMPAGMELFPAANDSQWDWIKKVIDDSDYYIVIIGDKYGTVNKEKGLSYTEMEYRYAIEKDIPAIAFLRDNIDELPKKYIEEDKDNREKLEEFKNLVKKKLCKFYSSPSDLGAKVSRSITQIKKQYPREGWVKGSNIKKFVNSDVVLKLKNENEKLKKNIENLKQELDLNNEKLSSGDDEIELNVIYTRRKIDPETNGLKKIGESNDFYKTTWNELFYIVGNGIHNERYLSSIKSGIDEKINEEMLEIIERKHPDERIYDLQLTLSVFNKVLFQFKILKLILFNKNSYGTENIQFTNIGEKVYENMRAIRKGVSRIE